MERKESIEKDATSKQTVEDLEKNEDISTVDADKSNLPSPDGTLDEPGELKDADPV